MNPGTNNYYWNQRTALVRSQPISASTLLGGRVVLVTQAEFSAIVGIGKDLLTGLAAGCGIFVAFSGLKTWKRQLHGNASYDLSRRLLRASYRLREAFSSVRSPFMSGGEIEAALTAAGLKDAPPEVQRKRSQEVAYQVRWDLLAKARVEFDAEMLEAEVLWGADMRPLGMPVRACMGELYAALTRYVGGRVADDPKAFSAVHEIVFASGDDALSKKLDGAIGDIENALRPHLKL